VSPPPLRLAALHLLALSAFAIAQPLLDLLGRYPAFFAAHQVTGFDLVLFALVVLLVPAFVLFALEALVGLADDRARAVVHLVFLGALFALFALEILRRLGWAPVPTILLALAIGAGGAYAYQRFTGVQRAATVLAVFPALLLFLFVFTSNSSSLITGGEAKVWESKATFRPPIVLVTFDAFPGQMLMDRRDHIDAERFPNFAAFVREGGTWYPNATNAHENTTYSVPSILDGKFPEAGQSPTVQDHPDNLFTLLGHTYDMDVSEEATNLCPADLCNRPNEGSASDQFNVLVSDVSVVFEYLIAPDAMREDLPPISDRWRDFRNIETGPGKQPHGVLERLASGQRPERFRRSLAAIGAERRPTLDFIHTLLPHEPLQYLPDGRDYEIGTDHDPSLDGPPSYDNAFLSDQAFQRHMLQSGYADRLVGSLMARLKEQGLWDKALVIVTADHGESFKVKPGPAPPFVPGKLGYRRDLTQENAADIVPVPLFVKYPGKKKGGIDKNWGRTIDILPTIADVLGIELPFKVDGQTLLPPRPVPRTITVRKSDGEDVQLAVPALQAAKDESLRRQLDLLGTTWDDVYRIGPHRDLIGKSVDDIAQLPRGELSASVEDAGKLTDVDLDANVYPGYVGGTIDGGDPAGHDLVFAIDDKIVSTGVSFDDIGTHRLNFASLLPPSALHAGRNVLTVYEYVDDEPRGGLRPLGSTGSLPG
jgi:hypothetical protein